MNDAQGRVNMGGAWLGRLAPRRPSAVGLAFRIAAVLMVPPVLAVAIVAAAVCLVLVAAFVVVFIVALIIAPIALMISRLFTPRLPEPADDGRRNVRVIGQEELPADDT
jgi:hypothetical protein